MRLSEFSHISSDLKRCVGKLVNVYVGGNKPILGTLKVINNDSIEVETREEIIKLGVSTVYGFGFRKESLQGIELLEKEGGN